MKGLKYFLVRKVAKLLIVLIVKSCRFRIRGGDVPERLRKEGVPIIYVYWHRHIFVTIYRFWGSGARPLISLSEDGELVAQVGMEFGLDPVRGSSSRGGARAFMELARTIKDNRSEVLITADGPKGPAGKFKDGAIRLAQKTGAAVVPIAWHSTKVKVFEKTWDRFKIPVPFGSITYAYGEAVRIPPQVPKNDFGPLREQLEKAVNQLEEDLEKELEKN